MHNENILEVLKDKKFLIKIVNLTDIEDVKKAFKSKGINVDDQDIEEMRQGALGYMKGSKVENEFLDIIAGGEGESDKQPIIINNYITNDNTNINKSSSQSSSNVNSGAYYLSSRPVTNAEGVALGSIFVLAGAVIAGIAIKGGIRNGWFSPMC